VLAGQPLLAMELLVLIQFYQQLHLPVVALEAKIVV
jgi:hypothetical protein